MGVYDFLQGYSHLIKVKYLGLIFIVHRVLNGAFGFT